MSQRAVLAARQGSQDCIKHTVKILRNCFSKELQHNPGSTLVSSAANLRCQSSLKMSPSLPRLKCPLFVFWFALFFFPCARSPFSSKNFALGCPRNDDSYLGRPTASPVFGRPVGLVRSAVLRSPKGGAFRAQRRARPTTAGLRRPPWTRASPSLGESPLATGDSLAAPTSFWPSAELADWPA